MAPLGLNVLPFTNIAGSVIMAKFWFENGTKVLLDGDYSVITYA